MPAKYLKPWWKTVWVVKRNYLSIGWQCLICTCLQCSCDCDHRFLHHFSCVFWRPNAVFSLTIPTEGHVEKKEKWNKNKPACLVCWRMLCQFIKSKSIFKTKYQTSMLQGEDQQAHSILQCKITVDTGGTLFQFVLDQFLMRVRRTCWYWKHISESSLQL